MMATRARSYIIMVGIELVSKLHTQALFQIPVSFLETVLCGTRDFIPDLSVLDAV